MKSRIVGLFLVLGILAIAGLVWANSGAAAASETATASTVWAGVEQADGAAVEMARGCGRQAAEGGGCQQGSCHRGEAAGSAGQGACAEQCPHGVKCACGEECTCGEKCACPEECTCGEKCPGKCGGCPKS